MTDEQITAAYLKSAGIDISRVLNGIAMARAFIEAGADCVEIFRRPE